MFPERNDTPPSRLVGGAISAVPCAVTRGLRLPVLCIGLRPLIVGAALMPKAAVHEHDNPVFLGVVVWRPEQTGLARAVHELAPSTALCDVACAKLQPGHAAYPRHEPAALLLAEEVQGQSVFLGMTLAFGGAAVPMAPASLIRLGMTMPSCFLTKVYLPSTGCFPCSGSTPS